MTRSKSDIISPERIYTPSPINILCETRILKCNSVETFIKGLTRPNYPKKANINHQEISSEGINTLTLQICCFPIIAL